MWVIIEAEKSHSQPSASWRPRKVGGVVGSSESLRTSGVDSNPGLKVWEPGAPRAEDWCPNSSSEAETETDTEAEHIHPSPTFWFYSGLPTLGRSICFTQSTNSNANLSLKHIQQKCLTRYLGIPWSSQVDTSINCHTGKNGEIK